MIGLQRLNVQHVSGKSWQLTALTSRLADMHMANLNLDNAHTQQRSSFLGERQ
jgi:hypothetical protein